jgi:hypothetical protein
LTVHPRLVAAWTSASPLLTQAGTPHWMYAIVLPAGTDLPIGSVILMLVGRCMSVLMCAAAVGYFVPPDPAGPPLAASPLFELHPATSAAAATSAPNARKPRAGIGLSPRREARPSACYGEG